MLDVGLRNRLRTVAHRHLSFARSRRGRRRWCAFERDAQDFVDPLRWDDLQSLRDGLRQIGQILSVLVRNDHRADAATQRREQLFLEATDGKYPATQGY